MIHIWLAADTVAAVADTVAAETAHIVADVAVGRWGNRRR